MNLRENSKSVSIIFYRLTTPLFLVVIGNEKTLEYWEYKKGEFVQSFKSAQPFANEISRVVISGSNDKAAVFLAIGSQIKGVTKRGKDFFKLDTSHTEPIIHLHVLGTNLWSAGTFTLNCYASANNAITDKYFFVCDDKINQMIVHFCDLTRRSGETVPLVLLACQDSTIKVIADNGRLQYQAILDSQPTCIALVEDVEQEEPSNNPQVVVFGLQNGNIGALEL